MSKYIYLKDSDEVAGPIQREAPIRPHIIADPEVLSYYIKVRQDWETDIRALPHYKVTGTHSWSDQQVLELGKDFTIGTCCEWECDGSCEINGTRWAIPIKSDSRPQPKELEQAAKEYADRFYPVKEYDCYESDYDYRTQCSKNGQLQEHFEAGANWQSNLQGELYRWVKEKPKFDREFTFMTATWIKDHWNYSEWQIVKIDSDEGWYYGLCQGDGEEWGDHDDLAADLYFVLPTPQGHSTPSTIEQGEVKP